MRDAAARSIVGILTSRIGRRFVGLFLVCALLPLVAFAWLAVSHATGQMREELRTSLHGAAKTAGMGIAARLSQVAGDLSLLRELLERRAASGETIAVGVLQQHTADRCAALWLQRAAGTVEVLCGDRQAAVPSADFDAADRAHLAAGKPMLCASGSPRRLCLVAALEPQDPDAGLLCAQLREQWFWDPEELRVAGSQFAAFDSQWQPLFYTFKSMPDVQPLVTAQAEAKNRSSGSCEWTADGEPCIARYWRAFLQPQYRFDLFVVQSRTMREAFAVSEQFTGWFFATAVSTLLLVLLVGLVQMRRTLDPIVALGDATAAVAAGDLGVRVEVGRRDELGDLAVAFNGMTTQLQENVARRERTERELVASRDAALAAVRAKAEFVTNVSHEFRTPMTEILSAIEILGSLAASESDAREEFSAIALRGAQRLAQLVDDVLELGRTDAWPTAPVDVAATLHDAVARLPKSGRERIGFALAPGLSPILGDRERLVQVWARLLDNALKFSPADKPVEVRARSVAGSVVVEVVDRGPGIAKADRARIFEPFCQVGRDQLIDKANGTGLGLTLAKATIDRHGGRIEVDGEPGQGALFRVFLPVRVAAAAQA